LINIPVFKHDDIETFFTIDGEGEPLLLVTGLGAKHTSWTFQVPFFKQKMKVITLDNRGVGQSSRPNYSYTMDMFVEDVKNLLDHLGIQEQIHLCGISLGGMIAQNFVLKYPDKVKTLILCATTTRIDPSPLVNNIKLSRSVSKETAFELRLKYLFSFQFRKKLKQNEVLYQALKTEYMKDSTELQDYINQAAAVKEHDTRNLLETIKQPTLIMVGSKDKLLPPPQSEIIHSKIPNSILKVFDEPGHGFIVEIADEVNEVLWNFIKEHLG
jgi:pimeloyl-ACP methyl ester carboxylesterase